MAIESVPNEVFVEPMGNWKQFNPLAHPPLATPTITQDYATLHNVLTRAYDQAATGKGAQRHAQNQSFDKQPMQTLIELYGVGFALGQAGKKAQESLRMDKDAAVRELLGAIVYIAGAIISLEKQ